MKIIHTFVPIVKKNIDRYTLYNMTLSVLLAKRFYEKVVLYTNEEIGALIKKIGIPYDEINTDILNNFTDKTFSIPKLLVYSVQDEPFIHIDLDTFIFDKIEFKNKKKIYSTFPEGNGKILNFDKSNTSFYNTYLIPVYNNIQDKLQEEFSRNIVFKNVPNMCVFGGYNYKLISEATKYCLDIYDNNKDFFDSDYYNACIIEQLFIPSAIRMLSKKKKSKFKFIFKNNPTFINFMKEKSIFPFMIKSNNKDLWIGNENDLFKNTMYNFNGFLHLNGYKYLDEINFIIKQKIIEDFNKYNLVINIDNKIIENTDKCDSYCVEYSKYLKNLVSNLDKVNSKKIILL